MPDACHGRWEDADHVLILVNPKAGRGPSQTQLDALVRLLRQRYNHVTLTGDLDDVCANAGRIYHEGRLRALVSVGGDGTAAELVNRTPPGVPICVYPSGTSNLLARYFALKPNPACIASAITEGTLLHLDAGSANGRVFLMMASCGFDAEVVREVHRRRQQEPVGRFSYWSYVKPIRDTIRSYQYPEIRIYWQGAAAGSEQPLPASWVGRWVFAFNLPLYGWGLPLAFWADGSDGLLDVVTLQRGSLWQALRYVIAAEWRCQRRLPDCGVGRAARLTITADTPVAYQIDGDPGGWLPLDIQVLPHRLTFLVPKGHRLRA